MPDLSYDKRLTSALQAWLDCVRRGIDNSFELRKQYPIPEEYLWVERECASRVGNMDAALIYTRIAREKGRTLRRPADWPEEEDTHTDYEYLLDEYIRNEHPIVRRHREEMIANMERMFSRLKADMDEASDV